MRAMRNRTEGAEIQPQDRALSGRKTGCSNGASKFTGRASRHKGFLAAVLVLAAILIPASHTARAATPKKDVIAYVFPDGKTLQPDEVVAAKLTRINYAFANIKDGRIVIGDPSDVQNYAALVALKKENPSLQVLVSVGGWLWSGAFSDMALTGASRDRFVQSVVDFIRLYQLDGLDVDWEYPAMAGSTNHFRPEDKHNYTLLLSGLRARFDREEKALHRQLYLSVAVGGESDFIENTEMGEVQKYVDTINVMAYDYYEPGSQPITGNQAPLFADPADPKKISGDRTVHEYEEAGVPPGKIVLGMPFYVHTWSQVPDKNHGLFQPGKKGKDDFGRFADVTDTMRQQGFTRYWDASASAPYLYNPATHIFISYDDPESLTLKCNYILSHKLAGAMFWDYESDPAHMLLNVLDEHLLAATNAAEKAH